MEIETKNCSLDTLAVTIQALHVSGKQMTLAVFRQLPRTDAFNDDGALEDLEWWGLVRYQIKDEGDLWAVASKNGILYRCSLAHDFPSVERAEFEKKKAIDVLSAYREWEPAEIAYKAWWRKPVSEREEPCPNSPRSLTGFELGKEQVYVDEVTWAEFDLKRAQEARRSKEFLLKLTQLFISV